MLSGRVTGWHGPRRAKCCPARDDEFAANRNPPVGFRHGFNHGVKVMPPHALGPLGGHAGSGYTQARSMAAAQGRDLAENDPVKVLSFAPVPRFPGQPQCAMAGSLAWSRGERPLTIRRMLSLNVRERRSAGEYP